MLKDLFYPIEMEHLLKNTKIVNHTILTTNYSKIEKLHKYNIVISKSIQRKIFEILKFAINNKTGIEKLKLFIQMFYKSFNLRFIVFFNLTLLIQIIN